MEKTPTLAERHELGDFIRAHRARLTPAQFGLDGGSRRRTPGLRREELAQLCGISPTWYGWIEQGRDISVSPMALARLAAVLRLSRAERTYLFDLAGKRDPDGPVADDIAMPPTLIAAIDSVASPAYALDRYWNALAWNVAAAHLFVGWLDGSADRNLLRYVFLEPTARALICDWDDRARRVLAEFRAETGAQMNDPGMQALIDELTRRSPLFATAWTEHAVTGREGGRRTFKHPQDGFAAYEQVTFNLAGRPDIKLVILAPTEPTAVTPTPTLRPGRKAPPTAWRKAASARGGGRL